MQLPLSENSSTPVSSLPQQEKREAQILEEIRDAFGLKQREYRLGEPRGELAAAHVLQNALNEELARRGLDVDACVAKIEATVLKHLREHPLCCPFPSCGSRACDDSESSTVMVEERGGGFVAECEVCCSGTGTFATRDEAIDEWNQVAGAVLRGTSVGASNAVLPHLLSQSPAPSSAVADDGKALEEKEAASDSVKATRQNEDYVAVVKEQFGGVVDGPALHDMALNAANLIRYYREQERLIFAAIEELKITDPEGSMLSRVTSLCDYVKRNLSSHPNAAGADQVIEIDEHGKVHDPFNQVPPGVPFRDPGPVSSPVSSVEQK